MKNIVVAVPSRRVPLVSVGTTVTAAFALTLFAACAKDRNPLGPPPARVTSLSLTDLPALQPPISSDCAVLHVVLPRAGGVTATVEPMTACTGKVLPAVVVGSFQKGTG